MFEELRGKTITAIEKNDGNDLVTISCSDGSEYRLEHEQDCCEQVYLAEVIGDFADLIGEPLLLAEKVSQDHSDEPCGDVCTWTFYKMATIKGRVTLRWIGTSNGYYSTGVSCTKVR